MTSLYMLRCFSAEVHACMGERQRGAHEQAPSLMADLYRLRCHSRKDSGSPAPEMIVQNSQSPKPLWPAMNLQVSQGAH